MEPIKLECTYEERVSKKSEKPYRAIWIKLNQDYEKPVMVSLPERTLIESSVKEFTNDDVGPYVFKD